MRFAVLPGESMRMKMPCEYGVWYILPCIRACLVQEMLQLGIPQSRVAEMLGITPASVCQYASKKRGHKIELGNDIRSAIQNLAMEISQGEGIDVIPRICNICALVHSDADIHGSSNCIGECIEEAEKVHKLNL
ncbi:MAG: transcriptional regulator [Methanomicrobiales archaeon]|nr:transcriptional regulator [Methanomicrobiales archaeon]